MVSRIKQLLDWQQLSPTQFADRIGIGRPVVSHILSERNKPSLDVVQRIIGAFPELSLPWLLSGTGPMLAGGLAGPVAVAPPAPAAPPQAAAPATEAGVSAVSPAAESVASPAAATPVDARPAPSPVRRFRPATSAAGGTTGANGVVSTVAPPRFRPAEAGGSPTAASAIVGQAPPLPAPPIVQVAALADQLAASVAQAAAPSAFAPAAIPNATAVAPDTPVSGVTPAVPVVSTASAAPLLAIRPPVTPAAEPVGAPPDAAAWASLAEPGKAIRRIVIFYRDGSFADYQPES